MTERMTNQEIVKVLKEAEAAMEVKGANRFRIRAYQNAINAIETSTFSVYDLWKSGRVSEIPGVGASLTQHINDLLKEGSVKEFENLRKDLPDGMFELIGIQGIGAKRAHKLASAFELDDREAALEKVAEAAEKGKIQDIPGFGEKTQAQILEAITELKKTKNEKPRLLWAQAETIAERVYKYAKELPEIQKIEALGSYRRKKETVGDLDFAVATEDPEKVMQHLLDFPEIVEVLVEGDKKASVVIGNEFQLDFRVVSPDQYGSMVQYFTGSKYHNIVLRSFALDKGYSLSEYGIKESKSKKLHEFAEEADFYKFLDLDIVPPEIRQGKNEVDLAANGNLPKLIQLSDIKGDLHMHTNFSDGTNTLEEMVQACRDKGYDYMGIADHAPSVESRGYAAVQKIITSTRENFNEIDSKYNDIKVLYGYEVNLLADASISLPDEFLEQLDFVIVGLHTAFSQDRKQLMKRYMTAIEHPLVDIIAHPTARLINERDAVDVNWMDLFDAVKKHDKILEINSYPDRLDLPFDLVFEARERGIKLIINTDAHSTGHLDLMRFGVSVARRGWCEAADVLNTQSKDAFLKNLQKFA
ncbi:DNA polymerase/3'-5' exonuclease PolX [candidate division WWE3 bacterium]|nr:DNA polymerase/3'-5' exonuclease PolX [candidate division WWE3 bacterium]